MAGSVVVFTSMPLWSALSDRIGRRRVYAFGAAGLAIWAFAYYPVLATRSPGLIIADLMFAILLHSAMNGPQGTFIAELFPTRIRYSGASLCYQVTTIIGGSWAPIISVALFTHFKSTTPISIYMAATCVISLISALAARETAGLSFEALDAEPGCKRVVREDDLFPRVDLISGQKISKRPAAPIPPPTQEYAVTTPYPAAALALVHQVGRCSSRASHPVAG